MVVVVWYVTTFLLVLIYIFDLYTFVFTCTFSEHYTLITYQSDLYTGNFSKHYTLITYLFDLYTGNFSEYYTLITYLSLICIYIVHVLLVNDTS
jgi:hypothetical protein